MDRDRSRQGDLTAEGWVPVSVKMSRRGKILNGLTRVLIPTCIPELAILSLVFPSLALTLMFPFLVIPTILFVLVVLKPLSRGKMARCSATVQRGHLFIKIPEVDILCMRPKRVELENDGTLRVSSRFTSLRLRFEDEKECSTLSERLSSLTH